MNSWMLDRPLDSIPGSEFHLDQPGNTISKHHSLFLAKHHSLFLLIIFFSLSNCGRQSLARGFCTCRPCSHLISAAISVVQDLVFIYECVLCSIYIRQTWLRPKPSPNEDCESNDLVKSNDAIMMIKRSCWFDVATCRPIQLTKELELLKFMMFKV